MFRYFFGYGYKKPLKSFDFQRFLIFRGSKGGLFFLIHNKLLKIFNNLPTRISIFMNVMFNILSLYSKTK